MLLFDSVGPNPKVVRMFIAEHGLTGIPVQTVDLRGGENRQADYLAKNPTGGLPSLQLADGSILSEITAICEYLDETAPAGASLIGATPQERAETRMWTRRIDLGIVEPMTAGFRYAEGLKMFSTRMRCIPQAADDLKAMAKEKMATNMLNIPAWAYWVQILTTSFEASTDADWLAFSSSWMCCLIYSTAL